MKEQKKDKVKKIWKLEFLEIISEEFPDLKKSVIANIISLMSLKLAELTKEGYEVKLGNLGSFVLRTVKEKEIVDINTKQKIIIPSYKTLKFKISKTYKRILN